MKIANKITIIICDDVRAEIGDKLSLMGIYQNKILLPELPALLPKLCFVLTLEGMKRNLPEAEFRLKNPEMEPLILSLPPLQVSHEDRNAILNITLSPFRIKAPGNAKLEIRFGGEEKPSIVHRLKIESISKSNKS